MADELLQPSVIYAPAIGKLLDAVDVRGIAHITGGGITGNLVRVLPSGTAAEVDRRSWEAPRIFGELQTLGAIDDDEMAKVFNLGHRDDRGGSREGGRTARSTCCGRNGHRASEVGRIVAGDGAVSLLS